MMLLQDCGENLMIDYNSTLPYFLEIGKQIPFTPDQFILEKALSVNIDTPINDFVKKEKYVPEVLNPQFREYLDDLVGAHLNKLVIWYWGPIKYHMAHIDCNSKKEIHPFAINWVLNDLPSQVNFYDRPDQQLVYSKGDAGIPGLKTENVTAYIPVDVTGITPRAIWNSKDLCILNTSVPHMIETDYYRVSASVQFDIDVTLESVLTRIL